MITAFFRRLPVAVLVAMFPAVLVPVSGSALTWASKASVPTARIDSAAATVGGTVYAIGGGSAAYTATTYAYDPATDTWATKAVMPTERGRLAAVAVGGVIYAIGGYDTGALATLEAYSPATNTWTTKAPMPTARWKLAAAALGGSIYAIGGFDTGGTPVATVEVYDPATNTWTTKAPLPGARSYLAAATVGGTLYAIGGIGWSAACPCYVEVATVEAYDPATNTWTTKTAMPTPRANLAAAAMGGMIYAVGGSYIGQERAIVEAYNPASNTWTAKSPMPTPRYGLAAAAVGGTVYAIGGGMPSYLVVEAGAMSSTLAAAAWTLPAEPSVGQWVQVRLTVTNTGDFSVTGVLPSLQFNGGSGLVAYKTGPVPAGPVTLLPGDAASFTWTYSVSGAGTLNFTVTAGGTEAGAGSAIAASATRTVPISPVSILASSLCVVSASVAIGQWVEVRLTVTNTGTVDSVNGVTPSLNIESGSGLVEYRTGPLPSGPLAIGPGSAVTFVWTYSVSGSGALSLRATATGTDPGTGIPIGTSGSMSLDVGATAATPPLARFDKPAVVYPNPVTGDTLNVALKLAGIASLVEVVVHNYARAPVFRGTWRDVTVADGGVTISGVKSWAPGVYLLRAKAKLADGTAVSFPVQKVLVKW